MSATVLPARPPAATSAATSADTSFRLIVLVGFPDPLASAVRDAWRHADGDLRLIPTLDAAVLELQWPSAEPPAVLCFGPGAPGRDVAHYLETHYLETRGEAGTCLVLGAGDDLESFESLVDQDRLFYLASRPPRVPEIVALLTAAQDLSQRSRAKPGNRPTTPSTPALSSTPTLGEISTTTPEVLRHIEEIERCRGLDETLQRVEQAAQDLVPARRALCRWVDAETWTLWRPSGAHQDTRDSAVSGLVGFVARTGRSVLVDRVGEDPRYDAEVDNGERAPGERFLAVALPAGPGAAESATESTAESTAESATESTAVTGPTASPVEAVLALARGERQDPFGSAEKRLLESLAREAGPILRRRRLGFENARRESETEMFRREALAHREQGARSRQEPLRVAPAWINTAYRALVLLFAVGLLALPFAGSDELAVGSAVVRLAERIDVRAQVPGVLERLTLAPGDLVTRGQELALLDSAQETAELEQLDHELELRIAERLRDPQQPAADAAFASLRERRHLAAARLERRILRAPSDGVVRERLARPGRPLEAGQPVLSLAVQGGDEAPTVEVLLPGRYRPLLTLGMSLRFKVDGYPDAPQTLVVREISQEVITPERARLLVDGTAATLGADGLVIVRADLPGATFESDGRPYAYFDGMTGSAEIRVRTKRFLTRWLQRFEK